MNDLTATKNANAMATASANANGDANASASANADTSPAAGTVTVAEEGQAPGLPEAHGSARVFEGFSESMSSVTSQLDPAEAAA